MKERIWNKLLEIENNLFKELDDSALLLEQRDKEKIHNALLEAYHLYSEN